MGIFGRFGFIILICPVLVAGVRIESYNAFLETGDPASRASSLMFSVDGNDFSAASSGTPVYLKLSLPGDIVLGNTLVTPSVSDFQPIYLPLSHNGAVFEGVSFQASPETLSVVRWVQGEREIWLKIQTSSSQWLLVDGSTASPTPEHPAVFHLGLDSWEYNLDYGSLFQVGQANMPYASRHFQAYNFPEHAENTIAIFDLSLSSYSPGDYIPFDISYYSNSLGVETQADAHNIDPGTLVAVSTDSNMATWGLVTDRGGFPGETDFYVNNEPLEFTTLDTCLQFQSMELVFSSTAFRNATAADPAYLKIENASGITLCETLVDPFNSGLSPIFLAIHSYADGGSPILADPEALSIVRWREGESSIWLKISQSTILWANAGGGSELFSCYLGLSAGESWSNSLSLFQAGLSNLPANSRNPSIVDISDAESTFYKVDLSQSQLTPTYPVVWAEFTGLESATGVTTLNDPLSIDEGPCSGIYEGVPLGYYQGIPVEEPEVIISAVTRDVSPNGTHERAGSLTMMLQDNVFPGIVPEVPVFIEVTLEQGAVLANTIVEPVVDSPIYLALILQTDLPDLVMHAPPDTMSIVRWMEGESSFWLKIKHGTEHWVHEADRGLSPAAGTYKVLWHIGVSGTESRALAETACSNGMANLSANTSDPDSPDILNDMDTLLEVDLSNSTLARTGESGWESFLNIKAEVQNFPPGITDVSSPGLFKSSDSGTTIDGQKTVGKGTMAIVSPAVAVQGVEAVSMQAKLADDIVPATFQWIDLENGDTISYSPSIVWDPVPTKTKYVQLIVTDSNGRSGQAQATLLISDLGNDINLDGENSIQDLFQVLPNWGSMTITDMLLIDWGQ
jgi:hypothetical protein